MTALSLVSYPHPISDVISLDALLDQSLEAEQCITQAIVERLATYPWIHVLCQKTIVTIHCILSSHNMLCKDDTQENNPLYDTNYRPPDAIGLHLAKLSHDHTDPFEVLVVLAHRSSLAIVVLYGWALLHVDTPHWTDMDDLVQTEDVLNFVLVKPSNKEIRPVRAGLSNFWRQKITIHRHGVFTPATMAITSPLAITQAVSPPSFLETRDEQRPFKKRKILPIDEADAEPAQQCKRRKGPPLNGDIDSRSSSPHIAIVEEEEELPDDNDSIVEEIRQLSLNETTPAALFELLFQPSIALFETGQFVSDHWNHILSRAQKEIHRCLVTGLPDNTEEQSLFTCFAILLFFYPTEPWSTYELHALALWLLPSKIRKLAVHLDFEAPSTPLPIWVASWTSYCQHLFATRIVAPMVSHILTHLVASFACAPTDIVSAQWVMAYRDLEQLLKDIYRHLLNYKLIEPLGMLIPLGIAHPTFPLDQTLRPGEDQLKSVAFYIANKFILFPRPPTTSDEALIRTTSRQAKQAPRLTYIPNFEARHLLASKAPACLRSVIERYQIAGTQFPHADRNLLVATLLKVGETLLLGNAPDNIYGRSSVVAFVRSWLKLHSSSRFSYIETKKREGDHNYSGEIISLLNAYEKDGKIFYRRCINQPSIDQRNGKSSSTSSYVCPFLPKAIDASSLDATRKKAISACGAEGGSSGVPDIERSPLLHNVWLERSAKHYSKSR